MRERSPELEVVELDKRELKMLSEDRTVEAVCPVMRVKLIEPTGEPADIAAASGPTWGVTAVGADNSRYTGRGVKVAVLDTGIDPEHVAFQGVRLDRRNYTGEGDDDEHGHGTHCAGTLFGRDVKGTRIGIATGVKEAFIGKVLGRGGGGSDAISTAINDAVDAGCDVISMSLGIDLAGHTQDLVEQRGLPLAFAAALALADYRANLRLFDRLGEQIAAMADYTGREIVLVAAAGNESQRRKHPDYEFPAAPPSEAEEFVSVGAVGREQAGLDVAEFSNTACNVCGPGVDVLSAKAGTKDGLVAFSGTSMATPHAAGVAALWNEYLRESSKPTGFFRRPRQLVTRLFGSATTDPLVRTFDPYDVGLGLVQAPR